MTSQKSDCHPIPLRWKGRPHKRERRGVEISPALLRQICTIFVFQTVSRPREQYVVPACCMNEYVRLVNGSSMLCPRETSKSIHNYRPQHECGYCKWLAMTPPLLTPRSVRFDKLFICNASQQVAETRNAQRKPCLFSASPLLL